MFKTLQMRDLEKIGEFFCPRIHGMNHTLSFVALKSGALVKFVNTYKDYLKVMRVLS